MQEGGRIYREEIEVLTKEVKKGHVAARSRSYEGAKRCHTVMLRLCTMVPMSGVEIKPLKGVILFAPSYRHVEVAYDGTDVRHRD